MKMIYYGIIALAVISTIGFGVIAVSISQNANATGDGIEIAELIQPMVQRTIEDLNNNNTEAALEELENINNELEDTFSVEE